MGWESHRPKSENNLFLQREPTWEFYDRQYRIFPKYGPGVNYFQMVIRPGVKLNQVFF